MHVQAIQGWGKVHVHLKVLKYNTISNVHVLYMYIYHSSCRIDLSHRQMKFDISI